MIQPSACRYMPKIKGNTCAHKDVYMLFIDALFIIFQIWKKAKCPLTGEE